QVAQRHAGAANVIHHLGAPVVVQHPLQGESVTTLARNCYPDMNPCVDLLEPSAGASPSASGTSSQVSTVVLVAGRPRPEATQSFGSNRSSAPVGFRPSKLRASGRRVHASPPSPSS